MAFLFFFFSLCVLCSYGIRFLTEFEEKKVLGWDTALREKNTQVGSASKHARNDY